MGVPFYLEISVGKELSNLSNLPFSKVFWIPLETRISFRIFQFLVYTIMSRAKTMSFKGIR